MSSCNSLKNTPRSKCVLAEHLGVLDGTAHFGRRNKFHGFGDLMRRAHGLHFAPDVAEAAGHRIKWLRLGGNGRDVVLAEFLQNCFKLRLNFFGDFYTSRAGEHLRQFASTHGGEVWMHVLTIVNDPYGQEKKVDAWAKKLLTILPSSSS
jgi:hypothetical protein